MLSKCLVNARFPKIFDFLEFSSFGFFLEIFDFFKDFFENIFISKFFDLKKKVFDFFLMRPFSKWGEGILDRVEDLKS